MNNSTKIDTNYLSIGPDGSWTLDAGSASAQQIKVTDESIDGLLKKADDSSFAGRYASILKIGGGGARYENTRIVVPQGTECAVDINNRSSGILRGHFGSTEVPFGDQIFSVKGESYAKICGQLYGEGKRLRADVLVDNWSDQSYKGSYVDLEEAQHVTGRKINVVKRYFASKVVLGKNARVLIPQSIFLTAYWWVKWLARKATGIKVGQKGPSWI